MREREQYVLEPHPGSIPEVAIWLGAMQRMREALLDTLGRIDEAGFGQDFVDWQGPTGDDNSLGTLLHHIAGVEVGWLYTDLLQEPWPPEIMTSFPADDRTEDGHLLLVGGVPLSQHMAKLDASRQTFFARVQGMQLEDWRTLREPEGEDYAVTPEWIVYHLVEHEAGHLYEMRRLVRKWLAAA